MSGCSKVYFADLRCLSWRENLTQKLARLMMTAGFGDIDMTANMWLSKCISASREISLSCATTGPERWRTL